MNFGYLIFVKTSDNADYIKLAYTLAMSIKLTQPEGYNAVALAIDDLSELKNVKSPWVFDEVYEVSLFSGWDNRSLMYDISPWEYTVCLDADMLFTRDISHIIKYYASLYDIGLPGQVYNYKGVVADDSYFRKAQKQNNFPSVYTLFSFFKKCQDNENFFDLVKNITENQEPYKNLFLEKFKPQVLGTDEIFGLASYLLDYSIIFKDDYIKVLHMKGQIQGWPGSESRVSNRVGFYIDVDTEIKIGTYKQNSIVHYVEKDLITDEIVSLYENKMWELDV